LVKILCTFNCKKKRIEMNKGLIIWLVFFLGLSYQAFAKAGIANDGFEFVLAIVGFLLLVAGFYAGIDYLIKNGKNLFNRFKMFLKKKVLTLRSSV
jgi:hypothetical protein